MPFVQATLCRAPLFAECLALGKDPLCRVLIFAERQTLGKEIFAECVVWHSAKSLFAECPWFATRQSLRHSAKSLFPVVGGEFSH